MDGAGGAACFKADAKARGVTGAYIYVSNRNSTATALVVCNANQSAYAADMYGSERVFGTLAVTGAKNFMLDHPLNPGGAYLIHSSVESSERLNIYRGTVTTDATGVGVVHMPDYVQALNRDFTYSTTAVGSPSHPYVSQEMSNGTFIIKSELPNAKVCWELVGVRQDVWSNAHPMQVEVPKPPGEVGTYLDPQDWGQPANKGLEFVRTQGAGVAPQSAERHDPQPAQSPYRWRGTRRTSAQR
jgi:hypothetical protein